MSNIPEINLIFKSSLLSKRKKEKKYELYENLNDIKCLELYRREGMKDICCIS